MAGYRFTEYIPEQNASQSNFDNLLNIFMQLLLITAGDAGEALRWLSNLDKQHNLTNENYGIGDFIEDLKSKGYLTDDNEKGEIKVTPKMEQNIRRSALEEIFGKLKKAGRGSHKTPFTGTGDEEGTDH